jgi:hypothetical protein
MRHASSGLFLSEKEICYVRLTFNEIRQYALTDAKSRGYGPSQEEVSLPTSDGHTIF